MRGIDKLSLTIAALLLAACPDYEDKVEPHGPTTNPGTDTTGGDGDTVVTGTTWHKDIKPLVIKHCVGCHVAGGIGTMSLETYEATKDWRVAMVTRVNDTDSRERMPPWPMDPTCRDVIDARVLTPLEKVAFSDWKANGYAEGDPSTYVAPQIDSGPDLGAVDISLERAAAYTPRPAASDDYRCFLLPRQVQDETWVRAVDIDPDQEAIVHHVLLFVVPGDQAAALQAKEGQDGKPGYDCLGGTGADGEALLSGWVPGMLPVVYPNASAFRIPPGSRFVMQMHYNLDNLEGAAVPADQTSAKLWTRGRQGLAYEVRIRPVADVALDIAPGENPAIEGVTVRTPFSETVIGVIPHMHLLGAKTEVTTKPLGTSTPVCLARIPQWDFHWQQTYQYEADDQVRVRLGDEVTLSCTFDNSDGTQTVHWGEKTSDEMCLAYLVTQTPLYTDNGTTTCDGFTKCMLDCPTADSLCPLDCMSWARGGIDCVSCALGPVYTQCAQGEGGGCLAQLATLGGCYNTCVAAAGSDPTTAQRVECAVVSCKSQLDAFYGGCLEALIRAGKCNDEAAACGIGTVPE